MADAYTIRDFEDATFTGIPARCEKGRMQIACFLSRPRGGGPICILSFVSGSGRDVIPPLDLRHTRGIENFEDAFGAAPFISTWDEGTLKAFLNYKQVGGGNNRVLAIVATGIVPQEEG